jgi:hypothetical protein
MYEGKLRLSDSFGAWNAQDATVKGCDARVKRRSE